MFLFSDVTNRLVVLSPHYMEVIDPLHTLYPIRLFGCSHHLNFDSQTHECIDILKMVSKSKISKEIEWQNQILPWGPQFCVIFQLYLVAKKL